MWEKEKLLVTSNFSFSRGVSRRLLMQTRKIQGLFGKGLTRMLQSVTENPFADNEDEGQTVQNLWSYIPTLSRMDIFSRK